MSKTYENLKSIFFSSSDKLSYFFPLALSFLFYFKIGDTSYWFDELVTVNTINPDTTKDFFSNYFRNELHPPLYFILLKTFSKIITLLTESAKLLWLTVNSYMYAAAALKFIADDIPNLYQQYFTFYLPNRINNLSEISVRLLSAVCMTGVNVYIFKFCKKNSYMLAGLLACLIIGLNHKMIYLAQDARPYALFFLIFVLVAGEFYASFNKKINLFNFKKLILLNFLLALTHYYGVFVVLAQILILAALNFKNRKVLYISILALTFYFTALNFVGDIFNLSRLTFLETNTSRVVHQIFKILFQNLSIYILSISLVVFAVKFLLKKNGKVDEIIIKFSIFILSILAIIVSTNMVVAIFYERYVLFLIPLFTVVYALILYSAVETLTFWFKNIYFKWIAFLALYLFAGYRVAHLVYANTFYFTKYYENGKYYPIKVAYEKISQDIDYQPNAAYVLEEHLPEYFQYYEKLYQARLVLNLNPHLQRDQKQLLLQNTAATLNEKAIYYIRAKKPYLDEKFQGPLNLPGYSKQILYNRNAIILFKFVREN